MEKLLKGTRFKVLRQEADTYDLVDNDKYFMYITTSDKKTGVLRLCSQSQYGLSVIMLYEFDNRKELRKVLNSLIME